ncbi:MAG: hypothetical protein QXP36_10290 [Conexivisphaerales archaeon]
MVAIYLNRQDMKALREYAKRVHLRETTALKQAFYSYLADKPEFRDLLEEDND